MARGGGCLSQGLLLKRGDDVYVLCSRVTMGPSGEENVGWPGKRVSDQIGHLLSRCQSSRLGNTEQHVTDGIMTCNLVPVATTDGHRRGHRWSGIRGKSRQSYEVACPASTAGSSGTPGRGGGDPGKLMVCRLANHQHGEVQRRG